MEDEDLKRTFLYIGGATAVIGVLFLVRALFPAIAIGIIGGVAYFLLKGKR